jgi:N-acetylmuramoyl-L-alanine amidase
MNRVMCVCVAAMFFGALRLPAATSSSSRIERIVFLGRDYVRLRDWAKANGFEQRISGKNIQVNSRGHRLSFEADSREVRINGISVWLSFPIAARSGQAYVSSFDLRTTIQPILFPAKTRASIRTIALDPGHGGKDTGNRNGSSQEKKYTLLLAQELRDQFTKGGFKVTLTRSTDSSAGLSERAAIAKKRGADLFLSLHLNAIGSSRNTVKGIETYCFTPAGASSTNARGEGTETRSSPGNRNDNLNVQLAFQLQRALIKGLSAEDRGVRRARFQVLRDAEMPAALIEAGFLSHPTEGRKLIDPLYRRQIAKAIVEAVKSYRLATQP